MSPVLTLMRQARHMSSPGPLTGTEHNLAHRFPTAQIAIRIDCDSQIRRLVSPVPAVIHGVRECRLGSWLAGRSIRVGSYLQWLRYAVDVALVSRPCCRPFGQPA